jgi:uridylate kinase
MAGAAFRRVLVKVSGEALSAAGAAIGQSTLRRIADDLASATKLGIPIAVVVGGGNIFRGVTVSAEGISRATGDTMGMLATVMNGLALESAIEHAGVPARTMSAISMPQVCETYDRQRASRLLAAGRVVVLAGGTANPYFTTDTTAVLRACELDCDAVLKATNVDGVYSADPKRHPDAQRYERLTHDEALSRDLKVMDSTAFTLARENRMPIIVFSITPPGAITAILKGEGRATTIAGT